MFEAGTEGHLKIELFGVMSFPLVGNPSVLFGSGERFWPDPGQCRDKSQNDSP